MTTQEVSDMIVAAREKQGLSRYAVCLQMKISSNVLLRIEKATNNYNMNKLFDYLSFLNVKMVISNGKQEIYIGSESELVNWMIKTRGDSSVYSLAKKINIGHSVIVNIEKRKTSARIDTVLKIIEALGYHIEKIC